MKLLIVSLLLVLTQYLYSATNECLEEKGCHKMMELKTVEFNPKVYCKKKTTKPSDPFCNPPYYNKEVKTPVKKLKKVKLDSLKSKKSQLL